MRTRSLTASLPALLIVVALAGCSAPSSEIGSSKGSLGSHSDGNQSGDIGSDNMAIGTCVDDRTLSGEFTRVKKVACSVARDSEIFESIPMEQTDYPGKSVVEKAANSGCSAAFTRFVGVAPEKSTLLISEYLPAEDSWDGRTDTITCLVSDGNSSGNPVRSTGTLKGSNR